MIKVLQQFIHSYGVNDIDGTIDDTTKIYLVGAEEQNPSLSTKQLVELIKMLKDILSKEILFIIC